MVPIAAPIEEEGESPLEEGRAGDVGAHLFLEEEIDRPRVRRHAGDAQGGEETLGERADVDDFRLRRQ